MQKCAIANCCVCGLSFRSVGEVNDVTCPHCGAELSFTPIKNCFLQRNEQLFDTELGNPLCYDEDLEGAPGFYGGN